MGRKLEYVYDRSGRQIGMDVVPVTVTTATTLPGSGGTGDTRFYYDAEENRVKIINKGGDVYHFVYDPTASVPAAVYEEGPTYRYFNVRAPDDSLINREKYEENGQSLRLTESHTYHEDGLGSTLAMTDQDGDVTDKYSYDAWGNVTPGQSNVTADNPYQYVGQLGYYTHCMIPDNQDFRFLQLGVRFYDPEIGRFTQRDRIGSVGSPYRYGEDSPIVLSDPSGLTVHLVPYVDSHTCTSQGGTFASRTWHRRVHRLNKVWFVWCLSKLALTRVGICSVLCGASSLLTRQPEAFKNCMISCCSPDVSDSALMDKIDECWRDSFQWVTEEYTVHYCYPKCSNDVIQDRLEPNPNQGWKE